MRSSGKITTRQRKEVQLFFHRRLLWQRVKNDSSVAMARRRKLFACCVRELAYADGEWFARPKLWRTLFVRTYRITKALIPRLNLLWQIGVSGRTT